MKKKFLKLIFVLLYLILYIIIQFKTSIISELINVLIILDFILIGGVLPYIERKYLALMQRRIGPKINGLNGRLQFLMDAIKLFFKEYYVLFFTKKILFLLLPILFLYVNLVFLINFQLLNNMSLYDIELNILYFIYFSMLSNIVVILTGIFSKNKYTVMASSRAASIFFINEILITVVFLQVIYLGESFSFSDYIVCIDAFSIKLPIWWFQTPVIIFIFLLEVNKVPFDFLESESELIMGYSIEYMGFLFGVFVLIEYIHVYIFAYLICILIL